MIYQHQGQAGKICAGGLNSSLSSQEAEVFIESLATSTCQHLQYSKMSWAAIAKDREESDVQYVAVRYWADKSKEYLHKKDDFPKQSS